MKAYSVTRSWFLVLMVAFILTSLACSTLLPAPTITPEPTFTPSPEPTATLPPTPLPSETPVPTDTPAPTATPLPLPTETPEPEPSATREESSPNGPQGGPGTLTPPSESAEIYLETFDEEGNWASGEQDEVVAGVTDGVYRFNLIAPDSFFWSTADEEFSYGAYSVTATAVSGPLNNGYGMMFLVDNATDSFYGFEISSDGYVDIYYCANACETYESLVDDGWFASDAVRQGLNVSNTLLVIADGVRMTFFVNDEQVGEASDRRLISGDIALQIESFDEGGVVVEFDDFFFLPLEETP